MSRPLNVLYLGGGTGGHIFPLYALYQWLQRAGMSGAGSLFVGLQGRIDSAIYGELKVPHKLESLPQPAGLTARLHYLWRAAMAWCGWLMRVRQFDVVVTSCGYGALPALLAARIRSVPIVGYEPNAVTGRTMRFVGASALRDLARPFAGEAAPLIRTELYPQSVTEKNASRTLLICGGSQGSLSLDKLMLEVLRTGWPAGIEHVVWLTGSAGYDEVEAAFGNDPRFEIAAYSSDMPELYRRAQLAVARAGASSIFELAAWGIAAVYVPLPWSADDHQLANARAAEARGWGLAVQERDGVAALSQALVRAAQYVVPAQARPTAHAAQTYWMRRVQAATGGNACA